jgi:hypothetical protein
MASSIVFSFHELYFQPVSVEKDLSAQKTNIPIKILFKKIEAWDIEEFNYPFDNNNKNLALRDLKFVKRNYDESAYIQFLLVLTDKQARDRSLTDTVTKKTRIVKKTDNEGDDTRVHVVMRVSPTNPDLAYVAVERELGSGIGSEKIRLFFNKILESMRKSESPPPEDSLFLMENANGVKEGDVFKKIAIKIQTHISNVFSEEALQAIKNGRVDDLVLINDQVVKSSDQNSVFNQTQSEIHYSVSPTIIPLKTVKNEEIQSIFSARIEALGKLLQKEKGIPLEDQKFKLRYKNQNDEPKTVSFDHRNNLELALIKKVSIPVDSFEHQPWDEVATLNSSLCTKIKPHLKALGTSNDQDDSETL